jgi:ankyrin repeat protein
MKLLTKIALVASITTLPTAYAHGMGKDDNDFIWVYMNKETLPLAVSTGEFVDPLQSTFDQIVKGELDINSRDDQVNTLLHQILDQDFLRAEDLHMIASLFTMGANIDQRAQEMMFVIPERILEIPQIKGLQSEHDSMKLALKVLNELGVKMKGYEGVDSEDSYKKLINELVKNGEINLQDEEGNTLLHRIVKKNHIGERELNLILDLLDNGADINLNNNLNETPQVLMLGISRKVLESGHSDVNKAIKALDALKNRGIQTSEYESSLEDLSDEEEDMKELVAKGNINLQDEEGNTRLHRILKQGSLSEDDLNLILDLLDNGADIDIPNNAGETPKSLSHSVHSTVLGSTICGDTSWIDPTLEKLTKRFEELNKASIKG